MTAVNALIFVACAEQRPSVAEWQSSWDTIRAQIPAESDLADPPDRDLCAQTLGAIRTDAPSLTPTPDLSSDDAVADWLSIAEAAFFECPPDSGEITSFAVAYEELRRLEREVDVAIGLAPSG